MNPGYVNENNDMPQPFSIGGPESVAKALASADIAPGHLLQILAEHARSQPRSRAASMVVTKLDEAVLWAQALGADWRVIRADTANMQDWPTGR